MKNYISHISLMYLLFLPMQLACSDSENELQDATSQSMQSNQKNPLQKAYEILSSPTAQYLANGTATAVSNAVSLTRQGAILVINAYNNSQAKDQSTTPHNNQNSGSDVDSDSQSDSGSESEFYKIGQLKPTIKRKQFCRDQQELQDNLGSDAGKTISKLTLVLKDYFTKQDPDELATQKDMLHTFTLLNESQTADKKMSLDPVIANLYNQQQRDLLIKKIEDHVHNIAPEFTMTHEIAIKKADNDYNRRITTAEKKRIAAVKKADDTFSHSLNKSKNTIYTFAYNANYLNSCASDKQDHSAHDLEQFSSIESYKIFLAGILSCKHKPCEQVLPTQDSTSSNTNGITATVHADSKPCTGKGRKNRGNI